MGVMIRVGGRVAKYLAIIVDAEVYKGLYTIIGRRRINRVLNDSGPPACGRPAPLAGYAAMAVD
jgi:hypothetical protein